MPGGADIYTYIYIHIHILPSLPSVTCNTRFVYAGRRKYIHIYIYHPQCRAWHVTSILIRSKLLHASQVHSNIYNIIRMSPNLFRAGSCLCYRGHWRFEIEVLCQSQCVIVSWWQFSNEARSRQPPVTSSRHLSVRARFVEIGTYSLSREPVRRRMDHARHVSPRGQRTVDPRDVRKEKMSQIPTRSGVMHSLVSPRQNQQTTSEPKITLFLPTKTIS